MCRITPRSPFIGKESVSTIIQSANSKPRRYVKPAAPRIPQIADVNFNRLHRTREEKRVGDQRLQVNLINQIRSAGSAFRRRTHHYLPVIHLHHLFLAHRIKPGLAVELRQRCTAPLHRQKPFALIRPYMHHCRTALLDAPDFAQRHRI